MKEEVTQNQWSYAEDLSKDLRENLGEIDWLDAAFLLDSLACEGLALVPIKFIGNNPASIAYMESLSGI